MSNEKEEKIEEAEEAAETLKRLEQLDALGPGKDTKGDLLRKSLKNIGEVVVQSLEKELKKEDEAKATGEELKVYVVPGTEKEDTLSRMEKDINTMKRIREAFPQEEGAPMVVKVTVTNGQARVNLPKSVALKLNLLKEGDGPGEVRYLLLSPDRPGIRLTPVEMTEVEEGPPVVPEGPASKPPRLDPKVPPRWG